MCLDNDLSMICHVKKSEISPHDRFFSTDILVVLVILANTRYRFQLISLVAASVYISNRGSRAKKSISDNSSGATNLQQLMIDTNFH